MGFSFRLSLFQNTETCLGGVEMKKTCVSMMAGAMLVASVLFGAVARAEGDDIQVDGKPLSDLIKQLQGENRGLQVRAAQSLAKAESNDVPKIVPRLIPVLRSERENDKFVAAQTLGNYGPVARAAVPDLLPMLKGTQYERNRTAAAKALGQILKDSPPSEEIDKVVDALVEKFTGVPDKYPDVRRESMRALGMIGLAAQKCIPKLDGMLTEYGVGVPDEDYRAIRGATAWTLGRMGPLAAGKMDYLVMLLHKDSWQNPEVVEAMGRIGPVNDNVVQNIMDEIEPRHDHMRRTIQAYVALERFGPKAAPAVPVLVRVLGEGFEPRLTIQVIKVFKAIGPAANEAVPTINGYLGRKKVDDFHHVPGLRGISPEDMAELHRVCNEAVEAITGKKAADEPKK